MGKKKAVAGILAAAGCIGALGIFFASLRGVEVDAVTVGRGRVEDHYTEEGVVKAGRTYEIVAEVSGTVQELRVQENDRVNKGDVLLVIDSSDQETEKYMAQCRISGYEAQLEASRIGRLMKVSPGENLEEVRLGVAARESEYQNAKTLYEGSQILFGSGDISRAELEQREAEYQRSLLALEQAKSRYEESGRVLSGLEEQGLGRAQMDERFYESEERQLAMLIEAEKAAAAQLDRKIEKCRITAPADGLVKELPVRDMSAVWQGQVVVSMAEEGETLVEADVLTSIAPYLKTGDPVEIVVKMRGKNLSFKGRIRQVYDFAR